MSQTTIAVDFDGVIHGYSKGWQGGKIYDPPKAGCAEALAFFRQLGWRVVIFTTRAYDRVIGGKLQPNQIEEVQEYMKNHRIPYDAIHTEPGKPLCKLFIDDNALRFEDNWPEIQQKVPQLVRGKFPKS